MRPKTGLPKRKALRAIPKYEYGMKDNPNVLRLTASDHEFDCDSKATVLSMFCGCGGFDLGLQGGFCSYGEYFPRLPFQIVRAIDFNKDAIETYNLNIGSEAEFADLTLVDMNELPNTDVLTGGFPCQDFSSCGPKTGFEGKRGKLNLVMLEYMLTKQPKIVLGENVPHLEKLSGGALVRKILEDFESAGYVFKLWRLYCPDYGLPQNRTRLIFVGVRNDIALLHGMPEHPDPKFFAKHRTIDDAIDDLIEIKDESVTNQSQYFVATKATAGAGQGDQKNSVGEVAYAMRANPKARIQFHHRLDRRLTVRECARLQSFPDEFVFPFAASTNVMQIGNAVPPIIGHSVGFELARYLTKISEADERITARS